MCAGWRTHQNMKNIQDSLQKSCLFTLFLILAACTSPEEKQVIKPTIEEGKFIDLLVDVNLLEAYLGFIPSGPQEALDSATSYYAFVFQKHGVTEEEYTQSLEVYSSNLELFSNMQQEVLKKLQLLDLEYADTEYNPENFVALNLPDFIYILMDTKAYPYVLMDSLDTQQRRDSLLVFMKDKEAKLAENNTNLYQFKNTLNSWLVSPLRFQQLKVGIEEAVKNQPE